MHHPLNVWLLCVLIVVTTTSSLATYALSDKKQGEQTARALVMKPRSVLKGHRKQVGALAFSPDGRTLATGADDGNAQLWDVATEKLQGVLTGHRTVARLAFSPDGQTLATVDVNEVRLWDVATKQLKTTPTRKKGFISSVAFTPDGRTVATASFEELIVRLWDVETGQLEATLDHPKPYRYALDAVDGVAFTPDGKTLVTASSETVYLWDVATAKVRMKLIDPDVRLITEIYRSLKGFSHGSTIYDLAISPDGRTLATASQDATAKLWDLATGVLRATLKGHRGRVLRLAFSRDGRTLATGSDDKTAKLWDVATGQLKATLGHKGTVWSIDFSPDGKLIATAADNDHSVKVWDVATGKLLDELKDARYPVAFSPDGRTLATGGEKGAVLLWDVQR
jgi:WD40 repeat protein